MATPDTFLNKALTEFVSTKQRIRESLKAMRDRSASNDIKRQNVFLMMNTVANASIQLGSYTTANVSGIGQYAKDQFNDQTYDIDAEIAAMQAGLDSIAQWIYDAFPKTGDNFHIVQADAVTKQEVTTTFNTSQTAGFRTEVDNILPLLGG